jgi:ubiquitin C-terminal hydrolase
LSRPRASAQTMTTSAVAVPSRSRTTAEQAARAVADFGFDKTPTPARPPTSVAAPATAATANAILVPDGDFSKTRQAQRWAFLQAHRMAPAMSASSNDRSSRGGAVVPVAHVATSQSQRMSSGQPIQGTPVVASSGPRRVPVGMKGLVNMGNTCYANSVLQCLAHLPSFCAAIAARSLPLESAVAAPLPPPTISSSAFFAALASPSPCPRPGPNPGTSPSANSEAQVGSTPSTRLVGTVQRWLREMIGTDPHTGSFVEPRELLKAVAAKHVRFGGRGQQDAVEFVRYLLDGLHEEERASQPKPQTGGAGAGHALGSTLVSSIFHGSFASIVQCGTCSRRNHSTEPFLDMSLPIPAAAIAVRALCVCGWSDRLQICARVGRQKPRGPPETIMFFFFKHVVCMCVLQAAEQQQKKATAVLKADVPSAAKAASVSASASVSDTPAPPTPMGPPEPQVVLPLLAPGRTRVFSPFGSAPAASVQVARVGHNADEDVTLLAVLRFRPCPFCGRTCADADAVTIHAWTTCLAAAAEVFGTRMWWSNGSRGIGQG